MISARFLGSFDAAERTCDECTESQITQGHTPIYELIVAGRACRICAHHFGLLVVAFNVAKQGKVLAGPDPSWSRDVPMPDPPVFGGGKPRRSR